MKPTPFLLRRPMKPTRSVLQLRWIPLLVMLISYVSGRDPDLLTCANLSYGGGKHSRCFSDEFLRRLSWETTMKTADGFTPVRLDSDDLFFHPFSILTGEGGFSFTAEERTYLETYLDRGGFLLASAGCSSRPWDQSFRREMARLFPEHPLETIPSDHPIFRTVYAIERLELTRGGDAHLEGIEVEGRLVVVYSPEGLNDTTSIQGCCCCGANEVKQSAEMNANIFAHAIMN